MHHRVHRLSPTWVLWAALAAWTALPVGCRPAPDLISATRSERQPRIDPDYTSLVIPPNIAPLNFRILDTGLDYVVRIASDRGAAIEIHCPDGKCRIPPRAWRRLLESNRGGRILYDVFVQEADGRWVQLQSVSNTVAEEPIDSYIVYRRLMPNNHRTVIRGIYQRDLESFRESALITLRDGTFLCVNCHTFHQNDPHRFLVHLRLKHAGMVLVTDGSVQRIDTQQGPMFRPMAFASWHPDGRHIAATCNQFIGHFPENDRLYYFQAVDSRGDLVVYDLEKNAIRTTKAVFGEDHVETHPCWSPDGKYIYYARMKAMPIAKAKAEDWLNFRSDLMRIRYDVASDTWGSPETVKAYSELGLSCAYPRPSPDGKYILHILSKKTTYPIHQKSSDVYLLDLATKEHRRLDAVCSDLAESYPRWTSNGRWFTFASNRGDRMSALAYMAYFDKQGEARKAFVLPQEDPAFYDTFTDTYNVVEPVKSRVTIDPFELAQAMQEPARDAEFPHPPATGAAQKGGSRPRSTGSYREE